MALLEGLKRLDQRTQIVWCFADAGTINAEPADARNPAISATLQAGRLWHRIGYPVRSLSKTRMSTRYLIGLLGVNALLMLISMGAVILFLTHCQFRQSVGHDQASFDKFVARVESDSFKPETMMRFTNSWFETQKQDHRVIQMEEVVSDRLAGRVLFLGVLGLLAVLFQAWMILSLRSRFPQS